MDRWTEIELFVHTAELGSITRAAEALDISTSAASRYLAALEARLRARLIERNSRRLHLTDIGERHYQRCKAILAELAEAESEVNATALQPAGLLRVTASLSFCMQHIAPHLSEYHRRDPEVRVHIEAANRYFDLLDSGVDLAVRTREFEPDSNLTIRRLAATRRVLAASPEYLARAGTPQTPAEMGVHRLLLYVHAHRHDELHFKRGDEVCMVPVSGLLESNDGQVIRAAALNGLGILVQPRYVINEDIVAGRLVPVLNDWDLPRLTINLAFPSRRHMPAKVRSFIDFLVELFAKLDCERRWTQ
jgi:DNA-binding transcriptional LysR family regulator